MYKELRSTSSVPFFYTTTVFFHKFALWLNWKGNGASGHCLYRLVAKTKNFLDYFYVCIFYTWYPFFNVTQKQGGELELERTRSFSRTRTRTWTRKAFFWELELELELEKIFFWKLELNSKLIEKFWQRKNFHSSTQAR